MNDVEGIFTNITCLIEGSGGSKCKRQKWSYFMLANRHVFTVIHSKPRGTTTRNPTRPHPNKGPETKVIRSNVSIFFLLFHLDNMDNKTLAPAPAQTQASRVTCRRSQPFPKQKTVPKTINFAITLKTFMIKSFI